MERLKQYLSQSDITQSRFAEMLGVKQPTVWGWLNGSLPSAEMLKAISLKTGLSIDELLDHRTPSGDRASARRVMQA